MQSLESYFKPFRDKILGIDAHFNSPFGKQPVVYADWTASGRCFGPIEETLFKKIMPLVGNTHSECTYTGGSMTVAYHKALQTIKKHVNANENDAIIAQGSGMTDVVNKLQRMLGLRAHEKHKSNLLANNELKPIVFVTHMEHHSNQTSWIETLVDVEVIAANENGLVDLNDLTNLLEKYANRPLKIAAITSCSNVTGIVTPYHQIAEIMHKNGGLCFVDFACSAPYINIDMHPKENDLAYLDAIYFSPHKFLGGPGTSGVLIFNKSLYTNKIPDNPGGGTVWYTNPWNEIEYIDDIEAREDGGTPGFLQTIKTALCIKLKEEMGVENMLKREHEMLGILFNELEKIPNLTILAANNKERLGLISFVIQNQHFNLVVQLLNDKFGVQTRGGCSCAGTYGHYLFEIMDKQSNQIRDKIRDGNFFDRPGWIRLSIHPTTSNEELNYIIESIKQVAENIDIWSLEYIYDAKSNEFKHKEVPFEFTEALSWL